MLTDRNRVSSGSINLRLAGPVMDLSDSEASARPLALRLF